MKKYIILFILSLLAISTNKLSAQDIASVINKAQKNPLFETIAPIISPLVFSTDSTIKISKENPIDSTIVSQKGPLGVVKRTIKTEDYIAIETSKSGKIEAKLLPLINDSKIVCIIKTVCGNFCDSQIFFYTTDWEPLDKESLITFKSIDWFIDKASIPAEELEKLSPILSDLNPVQLTLSPTENSITAKSGIKSYLSDEDFKLVEPYFSETKTLNWNKTIFK